MSTTPPPAPGPGWYPHPDMVDTRRYWDGAAWTDHIAPAAGPAAAAQPVPPEDYAWLVIVGYGTAVFLPILGLVCAVALLVKGSWHAAGVALASVAMITLLSWVIAAA